ncbi:hypothetical protein [Archaeoglobus sp.]
MVKTITVQIPDWMDENYAKLIFQKLIEIEKHRRELIEKIIKKIALTEEDLENFERFRDELWKKEAKNYFSL